MEQVAAVLDALSDAKETTRQQVIGLVERIALRLEKVESKNQQLVRENELLKDQLNKVCYRSCQLFSRFQWVRDDPMVCSTDGFFFFLLA